MKTKSWWKSLGYAIEGVLYATKTEKNLKIHIIFSILILFMALFFNLKFLEYIILTITISLVIAAELFNTAIEYLVDALIKEKSEVAKRVKDVSAGAVLITAFGAIFVGYFVLFEKIKNALSFNLQRLPNLPHHIAIVSLVITIALVVIIKSLIGRGEPLHGGMPSGHSAVAFSILVSVIYLTKDVAVSLLVFLLCVLVAESRVRLKVHSMSEVIMGGLLGSGVTFLIFILIL
ncbi:MULTISPECIES: diacylglycerol kinase [Calditerrivibrio]|uniref:Diacylglycerol kinase n=1 Tax=Calditerrivibrio nitroreducens TaxID=477976 RepID=A0A2J6WHJ1_9BACT|nr:MAG: diacylglycerol kinase [Calditerrivibrio nitroreducens]